MCHLFGKFWKITIDIFYLRRHIHKLIMSTGRLSPISSVSSAQSTPHKRPSISKSPSQSPSSVKRMVGQPPSSVWTPDRKRRRLSSISERLINIFFNTSILQILFRSDKDPDYVPSDVDDEITQEPYKPAEASNRALIKVPNKYKRKLRICPLCGIQYRRPCDHFKLPRHTKEEYDSVVTLH